MKYVVLRRRPGKGPFLPFTLVSSHNHVTAVLKACAAKKMGAPVYQNHEVNPSRHLYRCPDWEVCIRTATAAERSHGA